MKRSKLFALAFFPSLALAACAPPEPGTGAPGSPAPLLAGGDEATSHLAEESALDYLRDARPDLVSDGPGVRVRGVLFDQLGQAHARVPQLVDDIPVFGGELIVHLDGDGDVRSVTDGRVPGASVDTTPDIDEEEAIGMAVAAQGGWGRVTRPPAADLQVLKHEGAAHLTYRVRLEQLGGEAPSIPVVFVSAGTGEVVWSYDDLETAKSRSTYTANHGSSLPGTLVRTEGSGASGDAALDAAHDHAGVTHDYYLSRHGRDSYDGAGAALKSTVHYSNGYNNAFWNGSQMVYGDGDGTSFSALTVLDVVGHELTHAVTAKSSKLTYSGESGGLNEAMSDIFAAAIEAEAGGAVTADTWRVGEDCYTPGTAGDALRYMDDPQKDGESLDSYADYYSGADVHHSSGIANLAFYLMTAGGPHPRGKSSVVVPALDPADRMNSLRKAAKIFYRANTVYLTASSGFAAARDATITAATDLHGAGSNEASSVEAAWTAVGLPVPPAYTVLSEEVDLAGAAGSQTTFSFSTPAGATHMQFSTSGGTGDVDLYVKRGSPPTLDSYDCRPWLPGSAESCTFEAASGTYHVMLVGYGQYSGMKLTVSSAAVSSPAESCGDGFDDDWDGAVDCADADCADVEECAPQVYQHDVGLVMPNSWVHYAPFPVVPGTQLQAVLKRQSGNPDLYVRWSKKPTYSVFACRPYLAGAADEVCDLTVPAGVTAAYVGVASRTGNVNWGAYALKVSYVAP